MKSTLSQHEIMDLVEDIEMIINRACREKRRRMQACENPPPPAPPVVPSMSTDNNNIYNAPPPPPVVPSMSTDNNNIYTGPGPPRPNGSCNSVFRGATVIPVLKVSFSDV